MSLLGYEGLFAQKTRFKEGVALFFKKEKFDLEESKTLVIDEIAADIWKVAESNKFGETLLLAALRHKDSNTVVLTGTIIMIIRLGLLFLQKAFLMGLVIAGDGGL